MKPSTVLHRALVLGTALAILGAGACVPSENDDVVKRFPADVPLGIIQRAGVIRVAVPADRPPFSDTSDPEAPQGLIPDLARMIGDELGVETEFVPVADDVIAALDRGEADIAFPLIPVTEARLRTHAFSDVYYRGAQRLLVPVGSGITTLDELAGQTVCSAIDEETGVSLDRTDDRIDVATIVFADDCLPLLSADRVTAITGPDVVLLWLMTMEPGLAITGPEINTVGYSVAVPLAVPGVPAFINATFREAEEEGRWAAAYERWITPLIDAPPPESPDLSAAEAAALWPAGL